MKNDARELSTEEQYLIRKLSVQRFFDSEVAAGVDKCEEHQDRDVELFIACRPGKLKSLPQNSHLHAIEKIKTQVRAKVEHPFLAIKRRFGYHKVRYKSLAKNYDRLCLLAGFYNLIRRGNLAC